MSRESESRNETPMTATEVAFSRWWYDYCVKNGMHNPAKMREAALASWKAACATRSETGDKA